MNKTTKGVFLLFLVFIHFGFSSNVVATDGAKNSDTEFLQNQHKFAGTLEYQIGVSSHLELQDIEAEGQWLVSDDGWIREVFFDSSFWLGDHPKVAWLKYKAASESSEHWFELASSGVTRASLYYTDQDGTQRSINTDDPEYLNGYRSRFLTFLLTENMLEQTLYIRVESSSKLHIQVNTYDYFDYLQMSSIINFIYAIGYGVVLIMVLYNLILGWYLKDSIYYLYSFAILSALYYQFFAHGHARIFFHLNWDSVNQSLNMASLVAIAAAMYFLYRYANFRYFFPMVAKYFRALILFVVLAIVTMLFISANAALNLLLLISGPILTISLVLTLWARYKGVREAGYFALAWLGYILGGSIWLSYWLGILPLNHYVELPLLAGAVLESVLLSLALGYRIQNLNEQTELLEASTSHYKNLSQLDPLTKLSNRRAFDKQLSYYEQLEISYGLLLVDIDNFKEFNDTHGHVEGDNVLVVLSDVLRNTLRESDLAARLGGEEFGLLIACSSVEQLVEIAERARESFSAHEFIINNKSYYVSVSIGVGMRDANDSSIEFIERIDRALYLAKERGRNRVQVSSINTE
ncbi:MAG: diguanylate cyclase (GGDEF)-like protein [Glaciecola sp.]|jgi:diguanylate cyclase (GGDEF)-like protein